MIIEGGKGIGRIELTNIPLPEYVTNPYHPIYTASGHILLGYQLPGEADSNKDYYHIAVMDDDGSNFHDIFADSVPAHPTANGGLRLMPFADNTRVFLGDYILECPPDFGSCKSAALVRVRYPSRVVDDPRVMRHWSEIVVAPDNRHVAWTTLYKVGGALNFLGVLGKVGGLYEIHSACVISSMDVMEDDPQNAGCYRIKPMRGGEIKQFIHGGLGLSLVGAIGGALPGSVEQDLTSDAVIPVTNQPGYDETTIYSPDEKLGITMSTRNSPGTNFAILGLLPRPYALLVTMGLAFHVYLYAVAGVRKFRKGNIGPALIDIARSKADPAYFGVPLNDFTSDFIYHSPMSWHPSGMSVMWPEVTRGGGKGRVRAAHLLDYKPGAAVPAVVTPDAPPYAGSIDAFEPSGFAMPDHGNFIGKHSGYAEFTTAGMGSARISYHDYSDDGRSFLNGAEFIANDARVGNTIYQSKITLNGEDEGEMDLRLTFIRKDWDSPTSLSYDTAEDGLPASRGFARYNGKTIRIEDMEK
ncbi:MAG: hypothetical protein LBS11_00935 [Oscillospiraceae bacterium]|jgi:hypothetical protein|nr:hypothetical protein [Oscillospiraceae bacterium]